MFSNFSSPFLALKNADFLAKMNTLKTKFKNFLLLFITHLCKINVISFSDKTQHVPGLPNAWYTQCWCPLCNGTVKRTQTAERHAQHFASVQNYCQTKDKKSNLKSLSVGDDRDSDFETLSCNGDASFQDDDPHSPGMSCYSNEPTEEVSVAGVDEILPESQELINTSPNLAPPQPPQQHSDIQLREFILRLLKDKVRFGWSRAETLSQLQSFFELTNDQRIPHKDWEAVLKFLKNIGYESARLYKVCMAKDHVKLLVDKENCPECGTRWDKAYNYFVLGLDYENIFSNPEHLKKCMSHWKNREEWFKRNDTVNVPRKEQWHGKRYQEMSYFWDQDSEFQLPEICTHCNTVISTCRINQSRDDDLDVNEASTVTCHECYRQFDCVPRFVSGNPLNQVFNFHEDGFNAFFRRTRGSAAIQISSACTKKEDRKDTFHIYSFIATCNLSPAIPHKFDAFLHPLIEDIKSLYVEGVQVDLASSVQIGDYEILPGQYTVRCCLLLGTADLKAHQELGLTCGGEFYM